MHYKRQLKKIILTSFAEAFVITKVTLFQSKVNKIYSDENTLKVSMIPESLNINEH